MTVPEPELPPLDELADDLDDLDWSRERDGRMQDYAAPDDAVPTEPWEG